MIRCSFKNSRGLTLVGNLFAARSGKIIVMAHGFCGDKSMEGRFDRIAHALNENGYGVLAFDFSGCGESADDTVTVEREVDDLSSAIAFAEQQGYERVALFGHSLGSLICLRCSSPKIETMVLSGAVTDAMHYEWPEFYSKEQMQELHDYGHITDFVNTPWREKVVVDRQMLLDFERIDQRQLLEPVKCPVLIIHGNSERDWEEGALLERSRRGLRYLPRDSRLEVVEGADHRFFEHLDRVIELGIEWYARHFE